MGPISGTPREHRDGQQILAKHVKQQNTQHFSLYAVTHRRHTLSLSCALSLPAIPIRFEEGSLLLTFRGRLVCGGEAKKNYTASSRPKSRMIIRVPIPGDGSLLFDGEPRYLHTLGTWCSSTHRTEYAQIIHTRNGPRMTHFFPVARRLFFSFFFSCKVAIIP